MCVPPTHVGPFVVLWDFVAAFSRKIEVGSRAEMNRCVPRDCVCFAAPSPSRRCETLSHQYVFVCDATCITPLNVQRIIQVSPFSLEDLEASACHR